MWFFNQWFFGGAKNIDFSKNSEGFNLKGRGLCFWILALYIQDKIPVLKK